ncbi:type I secretion system LssZ [Legionella lansingensis]|uniref:Type I secretion system LssZ n=1 Tax=Legionella lansingensis TaxID=45067 RepID=A0A0W0VIY4_9GAMM|nr:hypothetical protein [Legionella lansingensis]KTD20082.1 type I secretion system LssZ [Legionella lansingensis]SNV51071.1 type I secretion system LssZ [Legionella lansingensis]
MITIADVIHSLLPVLGLVLLFLGIKFKRNNYVLLALWISLIILLLEYKASGGEILGSYFNYFHAAIYSLNLLVLISSIIYLIFIPLYQVKHVIVRYSAGFLSAILVTGLILLIINLGINAYFVEDRLSNTPILQVATFNKQPYCDYRYVFYKISPENKVKFMCPNHYGLLPSVGELSTAPTFVIKQLPAQLQAKFQQST